MDCLYCGSDLANYEPVFVEETRDGERVELGGFCNYACLDSYVDEAELTTGDSCVWSPEG